jgi:hypothetical protein
MFENLKRSIPVCLLFASAVASAQNVSRLYITTSAGINVYNVASTGKLSLVSGSPFKSPAGLAIGTAGNHFLTVGTTYIHSYALTSSGGIGGQLSQINTALYTGAECGTTAGGSIDHTGQEVYVQTAGAGWNTTGEGVCNGLQTFKVNSNTGVLTFAAATEFNLDDRSRGLAATQLTLAPNNAHAYNTTGVYMSCGGSINGFYRDSYGSLYNAPFGLIGPVFPGLEYGGGTFYPSLTANMAADSTSHLAGVVFQDVNPPCDGVVGPLQLASYTVDYYGNLTSTNAGTSMPVPNVNPTFLSISPAGNLLAVGSNAANSSWFGSAPMTAGFQVFHFNGAKPITKFSATLTTAPIDALGWDKSNHLFAISKSGKKLFVYTITPTTIVQAPGSPYAISSPSTLFVRPL